MERSEQWMKRQRQARLGKGSRNMDPIAPLLTFPEAAERLGVPVADLYAAWHAGRFRANGITGRWRIEPDKLDEVRAALLK